MGGNSDVAPITDYVAYLKGGFSQNEHLLTAAAFTEMAIPLLIFFTVHLYYARGLVPGAYVRDRST